MADNKTAKDYNVEGGSVLHLVSRGEVGMVLGEQGEGGSVLHLREGGDGSVPLVMEGFQRQLSDMHCATRCFATIVLLVITARACAIEPHTPHPLVLAGACTARGLRVR